MKMADDSSMPAVFSGMQSGKKLFNCEWCHIHFDNEHVSCILVKP